VVCSAHEIVDLRAEFGDELKLVVPGIRPAWSSADDQKRIVTPAEALRRGADYLVIGRPIVRADDPPAAARRIIDEMAGAAA
jgi:orotidine-5'-phosphate decarboxylase